MILTCIAGVVCFFLGQKSVKIMSGSVTKDLKIRNTELEALNTQLQSQLKDALSRPLFGSREKTNPPQFTQDDLVVLRNLIHPDKHKNSEKANNMFVKVNSLIK